VKLFLILIILTSIGCDDYLNKGTGPLGIPIAGQGYEGHDLKLPHQDEAIALVWAWTYGDRAEWQSPPAIVWRQGDTCTDDNGKTWNGSFACTAGEGCCRGYYNVQSAVAFVEYWGQPFHETSLAHELCHAWRHIEGEIDADDDHTSQCFLGSSGKDVEGSLTWEANRRLKAVGW